MKLRLVSLSTLLLSGCALVTEPSLAPTTDIEATVQARVEATSVALLAAALPTATPLRVIMPPPTQIPTPGPPTPTATPRATRTPTPSPTPILVPTATPANVVLLISRDTEYYPVTGVSTDKIFESVESNGPVTGEEFPGHFTSGLVDLDFSYQISFLDHGHSCELSTVIVATDLVVTLPQHAVPSKLGGPQLSRWREFVESVRIHEETHVRIHVDSIESFKSSVESITKRFSDCDSLGLYVDLLWEEERRTEALDQDRFHETEKALSRRLREPVERKIDENDERIADYDDDLARVSAQIEALETEIDGIDGAMHPYDFRMAAIRARYPTLVLPSRTFEVYGRLRANWNRLNDERNGLIAETDRLVGVYNLTVTKSNRLVEETNRLEEELAWLP